MKSVISTIILSLFAATCHAMEVDCWSGSQNIYHGIGHNVMYGDDYLFFQEASTGKTLYINGNCVVKFYEHHNKKK